MDIVYFIFVVVVTIYAMCSIYEFNHNQFDLKNIVTHMGLWMAVNLCALVIGATLIGKGPVVSYEFHTREVRSPTTRETKETVTTVSLGGTQQQLPSTTTDTTFTISHQCSIHMKMGYRFMILLGSKSVVNITGRCDDIDSIINHPQVYAVLSGWGYSVK